MVVFLQYSTFTNSQKLVALLEKRFPSFTTTAIDQSFHRVGVVEGFISLDDVPALGNMKEVRSVNLGIKPDLNVKVRGTSISVGTMLPLLGTTDDQGVYASQHRLPA